jgi:hypothetical protein
MTRKDYVLIADVIKNLDEVIDSYALEVLADNMADALESDNPRFNRHRFLVACGVYDSIIADVLATTGKEAK